MRKVGKLTKERKSEEKYSKNKRKTLNFEERIQEKCRGKRNWKKNEENWKRNHKQLMKIIKFS